MATEERIEKLKKVIALRRNDFTVVMENIDDPHNISACLRSCESVGMYEVNLLYSDSSRFPKLGHTSSASAKKWLNYNKYTDVAKCFEDLRDQGKKIYTTHLSTDSISLYDLDLTQDIAIVFGNEHKGVSQVALDLADGNVVIPQAGITQSLNISVACAVTMFELYRQKLKAGQYNTPYFSEHEQDQILQDWILR